MIFLDSNIVIGYLNGDAQIEQRLNECKAENQALFISSITVAEVLALFSLSAKELRIIENFLDSFLVVQPDKNIAIMAAKIKRQHHLSLPDALIVASALAHDIPLVSRDKKIQKLNISQVSF